MAQTKSPLNLILLGVAVSIGFVTIQGLSRVVMAQSAVSSNSQASSDDWNSFDPPKDGAPGRRIGGGTRGPCIKEQAESKPIALMPTTNFGRTVSEYPTLLFYVPATTSPKPLELWVEDENGKEVYKKTVMSTGTAGVMAISTDGSGVPPLEVDKNYYLYFTMICSAEDASLNATVEGWIQRIAPIPELNQVLASPSIRDRLELYKKNAVWYDAVATLAELRRQNPNDLILAAKWRQVLASVELENVAKEPLIDGTEQLTGQQQ